MDINKNKGIYLALVASIISGFSVFLNKVAITSVKQPLIFTTLKNTIVGILILVVILSLGKFKKLKNLNKKDLLYLFLIGIVGGSLPFYLFFTGLSQTSAINGAIIQKTLVIFVAIFAYPILKEKFSKAQLAGVSLLFVGNLFIGGFSKFNFSIGELYILIATVLWSLENVIAKKVLKNVDCDLVTFFRMGMGSIVLLLASILTQQKALLGIVNLSSTQWGWVILLSLVLFAYVSIWYRALAKAPAILVSAILVSATLVTNVLSAIFVTHNVGIFFSTPFILMTFGAVVLVYASKKQILSVQGV